MWLALLHIEVNEEVFASLDMLVIKDPSASFGIFPDIDDNEEIFSLGVAKKYFGAES